MKLKSKLRQAVDRYAELALQRAEIEKELKSLRPVIVEIGEDLLVGDDHTLSVTTSTRSSVSVPLAKALMTAAQIAEATVVSEVTTITVEN